MKVKVTVTSIDELSKWLKETDPEKLHTEATKIVEQLKNLAGREDIGEEANLIYGGATFLEARATYLLLKRQHEHIKKSQI